jgi:hypothetical protein
MLPGIRRGTARLPPLLSLVVVKPGPPRSGQLKISVCRSSGDRPRLTLPAPAEETQPRPVANSGNAVAVAVFVESVFGDVTAFASPPGPPAVLLNDQTAVLPHIVV